MAVITISRQVGSGGDEIAQLVSKQLGYQLLDRELVMKLGPELGLTATGEVVDLTAERHHVPGTLERAFLFPPTINAPSYNDYVGMGEADADRSYGVISKIIRHVGAQDNAVIEGRGAMLELQNRPGVLHVRVVAPVEQRLAYVAQRDRIIAADARDKVREADVAQGEYIRKYYNADITDPTLYHLIINTGKVGQEAAATAICDAAAHWL